MTLTLTSGLICSFFVFDAYLLYYSLLSTNVSYARPIPLGHSSRYFDISCFSVESASLPVPVCV